MINQVPTPCDCDFSNHFLDCLVGCETDDESVDGQYVSVPPPLVSVPSSVVIGSFIPFQQGCTRDVDSCSTIITKAVFGACIGNELHSRFKWWFHLSKAEDPAVGYYQVLMRNTAYSYTGVTAGWVCNLTLPLQLPPGHDDSFVGKDYTYGNTRFQFPMGSLGTIIC